MGIIDGSGDVSDVGDMVSFAGMATLGHIRGRGPTRSVGRDEVGTCSDEAARNLLYRRRLRDIKKPTEYSAGFFFICVPDLRVFS